jgi:mannan endo-1,4-beta-mannosidase
VDDQTVMSEAVSRGLGYLGWSWAGNNDPILDMAINFDPNQLTTWGQRIFNGTSGIKVTAKEATIYSGSTGTTPPRTSTPPVTTTSAPPSGTRSCAAAYSILNQWPGGFQGEVRVTAGSAATGSWTVTWTFANGQIVTQEQHGPGGATRR